jgi:hypothetical protein
MIDPHRTLRGLSPVAYLINRPCFGVTRNVVGEFYEIAVFIEGKQARM